MIVMLMNNDKMPTHFFVGHTAFGFWKFAMIELRSNLKWRNTIMAWFENEKHTHLQTHRENKNTENKKKHRFPHVILRKSDRRQYYHKICYNVYLSPSRRRNRLFFPARAKEKKCIHSTSQPVNFSLIPSLTLTFPIWTPFDCSTLQSNCFTSKSRHFTLLSTECGWRSRNIQNRIIFKFNFIRVFHAKTQCLDGWLLIRRKQSISDCFEFILNAKWHECSCRLTFTFYRKNNFIFRSYLLQ